MYSSKQLAGVVHSGPNHAAGPHLHLILDWDGTITTKDTLNILLDVPASRFTGTRSEYNLPDDADPYKFLVSQYLKEHDTYVRDHQPPEAKRTTIAQEVAYLAGMSTIERASADRFVRSGVLTGYSRHDMSRVATAAMSDGKIEFSNGWLDLMGPAQVKSDYASTAMRPQEPFDDVLEVSIVSVNWFASLIRAAVNKSIGAVTVHVEGNPSSRSTDNIMIYGNDLAGIDNNTGSTGDIQCTDPEIGNVHTGADKLRALQAIRSRSAHNQSNAKRPYFVYVGDSTTDLPALVSPDTDMGICISQEGQVTSLMGSLARLGVNCKHVSVYAAGYSAARDSEGWATTVFWARDLAEVVRYVVKKSRA